MDLSISPDQTRESYIAEINRAASDPETFHNAFDRTQDLHTNFVRGAWDVSTQILAPAVLYLKNPENKVALEIGFGAGRLLAATSPFFARVIGVDVHEQQDMVQERLLERGIKNATLLHTDGKSLPVQGNSVDFVYSFIVLQHLGRVDVLSQYLRETCRALRPGGIAVLYVGRRTWFSYGKQLRALYWLDRLIETLPGVPRYQELSVSSPLEISLTISASLARQLASQAGFEVLGMIPSRRKSPNEFAKFGSQYGLILRRG